MQEDEFVASYHSLAYNMIWPTCKNHSLDH